MHLVEELPIEEKVFEDAELRVAVGKLHIERIERGDDALGLCGSSVGGRLFGSTERRRTREVELTVFEVRHLREPRAQRVEPNHVRVHLADTQSERIDVLLKCAACGRDGFLLALELRSPLLDLDLRIRDSENARCPKPGEEARRTYHDGECSERGARAS
jgi:hypothetical protein